MRVLLFSDSHGNIHNMVNAVKRNKNIEMIIHLGDCVSDILKVQQLYGNMQYELVQGNNDWPRGHSNEKCLEIEEKRIFITHGHQYNVKNDYQRIVNRGHAINADAVFFGHTHEPEEFFSEGMLVLNPGSVGGVRSNSNKPTYCIVDITKDRVASRFYKV